MRKELAIRSDESPNLQSFKPRQNAFKIRKSNARHGYGACSRDACIYDFVARHRVCTLLRSITKDNTSASKVETDVAAPRNQVRRGRLPVCRNPMKADFFM